MKYNKMPKKGAKPLNILEKLYVLLFVFVNITTPISLAVIQVVSSISLNLTEYIVLGYILHIPQILHYLKLIL